MSVSSDSVQPESLRALELLSLAEHTVRWEDDVTPVELRLYEGLYRAALRQARIELQTELQLGEPLAELDRTALLQLRAQTCAAVCRAEQTRAPRSSLPKHWPVLLLVALAIALSMLVASRDALAETFDWGNVSRGKSWVASSRYADDASVSGVLGDFSAPFFFHTAYEANPWLEIDLGAEIPARSITVTNRNDCCANRASPLVVETSRDHRAWHVQSTQRRHFTRWRAPLDAQPARWLRLRALRETNLHFKAVVVRK